MPAETRDRIVSSAAAAFLRQGYAGSGLKEIATDSDATFGSLYHFFPGGKVELAETALRWAGDGYRDLVVALWRDAPDDPVDAVRFLFNGAAQTLRDTDYADACPVATVALEVASSNEALRVVTDEIFADWIATGVTGFEAYGIPAQRCRELAVQFVAMLEGGFLLSRVARDATALEFLGDAMADAVAASLPRRRRRRST